MTAKKNPILVIIDGNALVHRAFHALPPLTAPGGQVVNAVYGFTTILLRLLRELKPNYLAVTFDKAKKTFRHEAYAEYKATRVKQPDELYEQFPLVKELVASFGIPIYELDGYEADDLIGTICKKTDGGITKIIVTGDQDTMQLVDSHTSVYALKSGINDTVMYDPVAVKEKYGLNPEQMIDYKALRGDPSDNIPGVKGIGEKTAAELLQQYHTFEAVMAAAQTGDAHIKERIRNLLIEHADTARLSKQLATIMTDVPMEFTLADTAVHDYNRTAVVKLFQRLGFKSLLNRLPEPVVMGTQHSLFSSPSITAAPTPTVDEPFSLRAGYRLITTPAAADALAQQLAEQAVFALDTETTDLEPLSGKLLGIGIAWHDGEAYYITADAVTDQLRAILANPNIKKVGHNLKFDLKVLQLAGLPVQGIAFDTMIASYLLNPGSRAHSLDALALAEFGYDMTPIESLIGPKGKDQKTLADIAVERVADYCGEDADYTWRLYGTLEHELDKRTMLGLLANLELPLVPVLATMELNGVKIDADFLADLDTEIDDRREKIDRQIWKLAGVEFNLDSPQQLAEVLFGKMKISTAGLKRGKTGISTAAAELDKLQGKHKIVDLILEHRELAKLQSTYTRALPELINPKTGRVHTSFNQTVTATGRLSSSDPNLQNIPIRTELGGRIRAAFIADRGCRLVTADYSQIELRVVASLAKDAAMIDIFKRGEDIHTATAAAVFGVSADDVTKDMRRQAKAVNFGILYGMGAFGLARRTGMTQGEAGEFIAKYFDTFQGVRVYIDETIRQAREEGYVETLLGRVRPLPEIHSGVAAIRRGAERMAINAPVQGTAADLMKLAMIAVQQQIELHYTPDQVKLTLQVHDELVLEVKTDLVPAVAAMVKHQMESVYQLRVPIEAKVEMGKNWGETAPL